MKNSATTLALLLCTTAIAALVSFPQLAQALPKNCGKTFTTNDGEKHCVKTLTASDEGAVIEVVSPLPEGITGWEYRQYRILNSCRNAQKPPKSNSIILLETRQVDASGKVVDRLTNNSPMPANSWGEQLGWKAFQVSCGKG